MKSIKPPENKSYYRGREQGDGKGRLGRRTPLSRSFDNLSLPFLFSFHKENWGIALSRYDPNVFIDVIGIKL
jgi:hypothetical protein